MLSAGNATVAEETTSNGSIPIPFKQFEFLRAKASSGVRFASYSRLIVVDLREAQRSRSFAVTAVSTRFFNVFTKPLTAGRDFSSTEEGETRRVVIVGYQLAERLGGPAAVLGQRLVLRGLSFEVIGVAPKDFQGMFGERTDAWIPASAVIPLLLEMPFSEREGSTIWKVVSAFYVFVTADGISSDVLTKRLAASLPLSENRPPLHISQGLTNDPARDDKVRNQLRLGLALSVVFTLVSSLGFTLLLLARAPLQAVEVQLKRALGAPNKKLIAELLVGPTLIVLASLVCGSGLLASGSLLIARMPGFFGQMGQAGWGRTVSALEAEIPFAFVLTVLLSLLPVLSSFFTHPTARLQSTHTPNRAAAALMQVPMTLQIALTLATCILTGMVVSSLFREMDKPLGYDPSQLSIVEIGPTSGHASFSWGGDQPSPLNPGLLQGLAAATSIPGVRFASYASHSPLDHDLGYATSTRAKRFVGQCAAVCRRGNH